MTNALCDLIEKCKTTGDYTSTEEFCPKKLDIENINKKFTKSSNDIKVKDGFMIFSKDNYNDSTINNFKNKNKFSKYKYMHRYYALYKIAENDGKTLTFILYNPSYANPEEIDDTIYNCLKLAKKNDYSNVEILNLFSLRQTESVTEDLMKENKLNSEFLENYIGSKKHDENYSFVAAWGRGKENSKKTKEYCQKIYAHLKEKDTYYIGINTDNIKQQINRHPDNRVWNGMGGFDDIAILVPASE